jgi:hypothetical protein
MTSILGWFVGEWLGIALDYVLAAGLVVAGAFLAFGLEAAVAALSLPAALKKIGDALVSPLRFVGFALIAIGIAKGCVAYGKSVGAADCIAQSRLAALQEENASLKRDLAAKQAAEDERKNEVAALAQQKQESDGKVNDYAASIEKLSASLSACRRATRDDDRRLCDIIGDAAPGCKSAR